MSWPSDPSLCLVIATAETQIYANILITIGVVRHERGTTRFPELIVNTVNADLDSLLADLTDPQKRAVMHVDGPLLVIAAAGSGKTRVITRRVAHLVATGVAPQSILAITFTNKAAGEMKNRISAASPRPIRDWGRLDQPWPTICTFHSLCLRILKGYAARIGLSPNFSVFDSSDQNRVVKQAMAELQVSGTNFTPKGAIHSAISNAKNKLVSDADYAKAPGGFFDAAWSRAPGSTRNISSFSRPTTPWISTICYRKPWRRCGNIPIFWRSCRIGFGTF